MTAKHTDLLAALARGELTLSQAEDLLDSAMASDAGTAPSRLGMSAVEWSAYAHGAHLSDLARWRLDGWPSTCDVCGLSVDVSAFGWVVREREGTSDVGLIHVSCLSSTHSER